MAELEDQQMCERALITASRERRFRPLADRDRAVTVLLAGGFVASAAGLQIADPARIPVLSGLLLLGLYLVVSSVEFEVGGGVALATQLVLVPMFLLLPP